MPRLHNHWVKSQEVYAWEHKATYGQFSDDNLTLVAHTKVKTWKGSNKLARQSFGMLKINKDRILFELCLWKKKKEEEEEEEEEEEQEEEEDEQNQNFQVWLFQTC